MVSAVAFCPHPPVLVPDVAQAAAPELDELREACRTAIQEAAALGGPIVLLGSGDRTQRHDAHARGTLAGFGVDLTVPLGDGSGPVELPLPLTVGAWLVRDALGPDHTPTAWTVDGDASPALPDDAVLVVLGDGSARRSTAAPGYLDPRAEAHDAAVADALRAGDPAALAAADPDGLLVAGTRAWRAAATATAGRTWRATLLHDAAPYGVGYFVAAWVPVDRP